MIEGLKYVIPGQYITPTYELTETSGDVQTVKKYIPGKGATINQIEIDSGNMKTIPVIVSTLLGQLIVQEVLNTKISEEDQEEQEGEKQISEDDKINKDNIKTYLISVIPKTNSYIEFEKEIELKDNSSLDSISINLPQEGDIVLVRITKLNPRQAFSEILSVEGHGNVVKDSGLGSLGELAHKSLPMGGGSQALSSHSTIASTQSTQLNAQAIDLGETFKGIIRTQDVRSTDRDKVQIIECFKPGDIVRAQVISLGDGSNYYLSTARNDLGVVFAKSEGGAGGIMYAIDWQTMMCGTTGVIEPRKCAKPF